MQPDGGIVTVFTYSDPVSVFIAVEDTGPGIPENIAEKVFQPFFTTKDAGDGTGLGLSVTYGIIGDHQGEIKVERTDDGGARFVIRLPIHLSRELASNDEDSLEQVS